MHAGDRAAVLALGAGGVDERPVAARNLAELGASDVDPAVRADVRRAVELASEGALELRFAGNRPEHRELEMGQLGEHLEHAIEPFVEEAAAAEPDEALARRGVVLAFRKRIEKRLRDRHRIERFAGEGVGRLGRRIAEDRHRVGALDGAIRLERLVRPELDLAPPRELHPAALLGGVVEAPVPGLGVKDLEGPGTDDRRQPFELEPDIDDDVVPFARHELRVRPVDGVDGESEAGEGARHLARFPEVGVRMRNLGGRPRQERIDDVGEERPADRLARRLNRHDFLLDALESPGPALERAPAAGEKGRRTHATGQGYTIRQGEGTRPPLGRGRSPTAFTPPRSLALARSVLLIGIDTARLLVMTLGERSLL